MTLLNEKLYMQLRLFRMFCERYHISSKEANAIFNANHIWEYVEKCYGLLHLNGDDAAMEDITHILAQNGVLL